MVSCTMSDQEGAGSPPLAEDTAGAVSERGGMLIPECRIFCRSRRIVSWTMSDQEGAGSQPLAEDPAGAVSERGGMLIPECRIF